jgi:hypothetical protein
LNLSFLFQQMNSKGKSKGGMNSKGGKGGKGGSKGGMGMGMGMGKRS